LEFAGSKGIIRSHSDEAGTLAVHASSPGFADQVNRYPNQHWELRHFIDCIQNGAKPIITPEEAFRNLEIAMAALESSASGRPVVLRGNIARKHVVGE
jgi:predicted dehydrogenase